MVVVAVACWHVAAASLLTCPDAGSDPSSFCHVLCTSHPDLSRLLFSGSATLAHMVVVTGYNVHWDAFTFSPGTDTPLALSGSGIYT